MCGIFGVLVREESEISKGDVHRIHRCLFQLSESRGKEASGFALLKGSDIQVYKTPLPATQLVRRPIYRQSFKQLSKKQFPFVAAIGHSRLVTDGVSQDNLNNQPVIKHDMVGIHNGIVVNVHHLWQQYSDETRLTHLDSEIIFTLLHRFMSRNQTLNHALHRTYQLTEGMSSIAVMFQHYRNLLLATDNGSLYYLYSPDRNALVFASEHYILTQLVKRFNRYFDASAITQLSAGTAALIDYQTLDIDTRNLHTPQSPPFTTLTPLDTPYTLESLNTENAPTETSPTTTPPKTETETDISFHAPRRYWHHYDAIRPRIDNLRRCTRCILPETLPYIHFDDQGVCNYCRNYKPIRFKGRDALEQELKKYRRTDRRPDCIVAFSGGRDSSYSLHVIKKELGMNPLAYSYDWGMITGLARRNQARMCGQLGVEHILVSADIRKKRANIRKNVSAWLKRPNLGTVPLFMAGDKQYFYYGNRLMKQNDIQLLILGENMLETTNFKSGFCGIPPVFDKEHTYSLSIASKIKMAMFYAKEGILNPSYFNSSVLDTLGGFFAYYFITHHYLNLFRYVPWVEEEIESLLEDTYHWETSPGTRSTWRIGDGTSPFYNYIYYTLAGFTENDTFRSNQVREQVISRENALALTQEENQPRFDEIKWYCDTIGIDMDDALKRINGVDGKWERLDGRCEMGNVRWERGDGR